MRRFRRSRGDERQQFKWFATSAGFLVVTVPIAAAFNWTGIGGIVITFQLIALPVSVGIAVLRYRLYEIDVIIRRTLVYGTLSALLAGTYVAVVIGLQALFSSFAGGSNLAIAVSTLAVAALFMPVRSRVQHFVDRRFYRRRYDAQRTLEGFGARLREQVDLERSAPTSALSSRRRCSPRTSRSGCVARCRHEARPAEAPLAVVVALTVVCACVALVVARADGGGTGIEEMISIVGGLATAIVGTLIVWSRRGGVIGWIFSILGLLLVFNLSLSDAYTEYLTRTDGSPIVAFAWLFGWAWVPMLFSLLVFWPMLFPDGILEGEAWRLLFMGAVATCAIASILAALDPVLDGGGTYEVANRSASMAWATSTVAQRAQSWERCSRSSCSAQRRHSWCGSGGRAETHGSRSSGSHWRGSS